MNPKKLLFSKITLGIVLAAAAAGGYLWWQDQHASGAQEKYRTEPARIGDVTQTVSANGTLNPVVLVNVGTQVSGTVKKLRADYNDHVTAGQVLLELDPDLLEAQVRQSQASLNNARAALDLAQANEARNRSLIEQEYISKQEFDTSVQARKSAQAQVELATAQLAKDRTNLAYTVIRSPVSGVVVDRTVDVGQTVAASFQTPTLFRIAQDLREMQIDSSFAEADIGRIKVGQPVLFSVDAFPSRSFNATVKQVRLNPTTLQNVVTYDVVVAVDNPEQILMPGMTAYVNIVIAQRHGVLLVPNAALRFKPEGGAEKPAKRGAQKEETDGARATIYVPDAKPLRAVPIKIGIADSRFTEVLSGGLKDGDQVVVGNAIQGEGAGQPPSTMRTRLF
jgi:HlyD family secretion protein